MTKMSQEDSKNKMKNKKALLMMKTVIGLVIAALCIAFLIYFLAKIVDIGKNEKQIAEKNLENIIAKMEALEDMEVGTKTEYLITGPKGWHFKVFRMAFDKPALCGADACVCFCSSENSIAGPWPQWEDGKIVCRTYSASDLFSSKDVVVPPTFYMEAPLTIEIIKKEDHFFITELNGPQSIEEARLISEEDINEAINEANFYP